MNVMIMAFSEKNPNYLYQSQVLLIEVFKTCHNFFKIPVMDGQVLNFSVKKPFIICIFVAHKPLLFPLDK